jgi:hypothetical protein
MKTLDQMKLATKFDFNMMQVPSGMQPLPSLEQTPNRFLSSIPKLNLEINHFEKSFEQMDQKPAVLSAATPVQPAMPALQLSHQIPITPTSTEMNWQRRPSIEMMPNEQVYPLKQVRSNSFGNGMTEKEGDRASFLERNRKGISLTYI